MVFLSEMAGDDIDIMFFFRYPSLRNGFDLTSVAKSSFLCHRYVVLKAIITAGYTSHPLGASCITSGVTFIETRIYSSVY